jgi:hypothetical protein
MERGGAEGLMMALQGVIAAWMSQREDRMAAERRRGFRALPFPAPAVRDGGEATPACC